VMLLVNYVGVKLQCLVSGARLSCQAPISQLELTVLIKLSLFVLVYNVTVCSFEYSFPFSLHFI
jgi:hypothetical protein